MGRKNQWCEDRIWGERTQEEMGIFATVPVCSPHPGHVSGLWWSWDKQLSTPRLQVINSVSPEGEVNSLRWQVKLWTPILWDDHTPHKTKLNQQLTENYWDIHLFSLCLSLVGSPSLPDKYRHNREMLMLLPPHRERPSSAMYTNITENGQVWQHRQEDNGLLLWRAKIWSFKQRSWIGLYNWTLCENQIKTGEWTESSE